MKNRGASLRTTCGMRASCWANWLVGDRRANVQSARRIWERAGVGCRRRNRWGCKRAGGCERGRYHRLSRTAYLVRYQDQRIEKPT
ncbi:hypothetical protein HBH49_224260 [Parastagonospora nodorum]|nr:hypothetical protein HBH49_224260 [Parastagonospora nodorum]